MILRALQNDDSKIRTNLNSAIIYQKAQAYNFKKYYSIIFWPRNYEGYACQDSKDILQFVKSD